MSKKNTNRVNNPSKGTKDNEEQLKRLKEIDGIVIEARKTSLAAGEALMELKAEKLFKLKGIKSFSNYCKEVYGYSASYANKLIKAVKIKDEVNEEMRKNKLPEVNHERILRAFVGLTSDQIEAIVKKLAPEIRKTEKDKKPFPMKRLTEEVKKLKPEKVKPAKAPEPEPATEPYTPSRIIATNPLPLAAEDLLYGNDFAEAIDMLKKSVQARNQTEVSDWMNKWAKLFFAPVDLLRADLTTEAGKQRAALKQTAEVEAKAAA